MKFEDGPPSDAAVAQTLSGLEREGGSVLVIGDEQSAHDRVCDRFLGAGSTNVLVCTEGSIRPDSHSTDPAAVIDRPALTRSASASAPPSTTGLEPLRRDIERTLSEFASQANVQVCFDSLRQFVETTDRNELVSFLDSVRTMARDVDAVVHFHLLAEPERVPVAVFDAVDAIVEVTDDGDSAYQQWHLPETGESTDRVLI